MATDIIAVRGHVFKLKRTIFLTCKDLDLILAVTAPIGSYMTHVIDEHSRNLLLGPT